MAWPGFASVKKNLVIIEKKSFNGKKNIVLEKMVLYELPE